MSDPLKSLIEILTTQTTILQAAYAKADAEVPSIDSPFQFAPLEFDPSLKEARHLIAAAAMQLIATVQSPMEVLQARLFGIYDTITLGFVVDVNIPEILKDAGEQVILYLDSPLYPVDTYCRVSMSRSSPPRLKLIHRISVCRPYFALGVFR